MTKLRVTGYGLRVKEITRVIFLFFAFCLLACVDGIAQEPKEGIIVNGDTVEYSTDQKEITASGHVEVIYKGTRLNCDRLTVNTQTKEVEADGHPRLDDQKGVIAGTKIRYNFETKTGVIIDSQFRANPYFGKSEKLEKVSDKEFIALKGYMTTCNYDNPHYRLKSRQLKFYPGDRVETKGNTVYVGKVPIMHIPFYNHSFSDPLMHVQIQPGSKKDWGIYLLTAWRYSLHPNAVGRIFLDYRQKLGFGRGFGLNYKPPQLGQGDFKFYFAEEKPKDLPSEQPQEFQRYLVRWRHRWVIDQRTNLVSQYYKIGDERRKNQDPDRNFLKDYFYREYEKDSQPLSYVLLHHSFRFSSLDVMAQKRTNSWYDQLDKLPEVRYTLPNRQIGSTPFYFEAVSTATNFNKKDTTAPFSSVNEDVFRLDSTKKLSLPFRAAFLQVTPFVAHRLTTYDKDNRGDTLVSRTIFYTGSEVSTKFYRVFNVRSKFLGIEIDKLRHVVTPTISYAYNHEPTIPSWRLKQIDSVDSIDLSNAVAFELSNKLQTKRNDQSVNLLDFRVRSSYVLYDVEPQTGYRRGGQLSDFLIDLELLPFSWLSIFSDAKYNPKGKYISEANYDINFSLGKERSLGIGQRYLKKGGNEITSSFKWRLSPKWQFSTYQRYQNGHGIDIKKGLSEHEYSVWRDMHCWVMGLTYNIKKDEGHSIWIVFKLKAFPEMEFGFDQSYNEPKSGSQQPNP